MIDTINNQNQSNQSQTSDVMKQQAASMNAIEKIFSAAQSKAVYGEPVKAGEYTIITACEVFAAGGIGYGGGIAPSNPQASSEQENTTADMSQGGGGGGGGVSVGRPIACIVVGPDGVKVQPIVDVAKIAVAGITTWKAVATLFGKMRK